MKKNVITIAGVDYPSRMTMGAMMEFKELTGKELTELQGGDLSLAVTLLFCCVVSACRADRRELPFSTPKEMADLMDADDFAAWQNAQFAAPAAHTADAEDKKKR